MCGRCELAAAQAGYNMLNIASSDAVRMAREGRTPDEIRFFFNARMDAVWMDIEKHRERLEDLDELS